MSNAPRLASLALTCIGLGAATPAAACFIAPHNWAPGGGVTIYMTVKPGEACAYTPNLFGNMLSKGLKIVERPRLGVAGSSGPTSLAYQAGQARGKDSFRAVIAIQTPNALLDTPLTFAVTIE